MIYDDMRLAVDEMLRRNLDQNLPSNYQDFKSMLTYHLGWEGEGAGKEAQGKRIRPILLLMCANAFDDNWQKALPAAAAIEYIHNFSLIHDDIQDKSPTRHGRSSVWKKWGMAQAINAGDLLFTLAQQAILDLSYSEPTEIMLNALNLMQNACVSLTLGQHLDLLYEKRKEIQVEDYWPMVEGKTAALIACSAQMGALIGGARSDQQKLFFQFGHDLGMAFQILDDCLGIWGDPSVTGKLTGGDLISGKNTLPILIGKSKGGIFAKRWMDGSIDGEEAGELANQLERDGVKAMAESIADRYTTQALEALHQSGANPDNLQMLIDLAIQLLRRRS